MEYHIGWQELDGKSYVVAKMKPIIGGPEVVYKIASPGSGWIRESFETATTGMSDWIGNIRSIREVPEKDQILLSVKGVYEGMMQTLSNIKWKEKGKPSNGQRVMVTEHVNVSGFMEMLATGKRILNLSNPNLNFINIGWANKVERRFICIDPYTGEEHACVRAIEE